MTVRARDVKCNSYKKAAAEAAASSIAFCVSVLLDDVLKPALYIKPPFLAVNI